MPLVTGWCFQMLWSGEWKAEEKHVSGPILGMAILSGDLCNRRCFSGKGYKRFWIGVYIQFIWISLNFQRTSEATFFCLCKLVWSCLNVFYEIQTLILSRSLHFPSFNHVSWLNPILLNTSEIKLGQTSQFVHSGCKFEKKLGPLFLTGKKKLLFFLLKLHSTSRGKSDFSVEKMCQKSDV